MDQATALASNFPDVRQSDHFSCGACAFCACLRHFGIQRTVNECKKVLGTSLQKSTSPEAIIRELKALRLFRLAQEGMSIEDLERYTSEGSPVICPVQDYGNRREPGASFDYGHWLTVLGTPLGYVLVQDSSEDNVLEPGSESIQAPGKEVVLQAKWLKEWHDKDEAGKKYIRYGIVVGPQRPGVRSQPDHGVTVKVMIGAPKR